MSSMSERFNALSRRERVLISVTLAVFLIALFFLLAIEPLMKQETRLDNQLNQVDMQRKAKQSELVAYAKALEVDPSLPLREERSQLEQQDQNITALLKERSVNLVSPQEMANLLEAVLADGHPIQLQKLTSLPIETLSLVSEKDQNNEQEDEPSKTVTASPVYKHGFELVMKGRYTDIYAYLQHLESVSEAFFWDSLDYEVEQYPEAQVRLQVHTLSSEEGWIGG